MKQGIGSRNRLKLLSSRCSFPTLSAEHHSTDEDLSLHPSEQQSLAGDPGQRKEWGTGQIEDGTETPGFPAAIAALVLQPTDESNYC